MDKFAYVKALRGRSDLTPAEYQLLITLWTYTDGECRHAHPGSARLAADLNKDRGLVKRQIRALTSKGFLRVDSEGGSTKGARRTANTYSLALPTGEPDIPQSGQTGEPEVPPLGNVTFPGTGEPEVPPIKSSSNLHQSIEASPHDGSRGGETSFTVTADASTPPSKAKTSNNAISEAFARSDDKKWMVSYIQRIAGLVANVTSPVGSDAWLEEMQPVWDAQADLDSIGVDVFDEEGVFSWGFDDRGWEIKPTEVDRYAAGKWLNKYLAWYQTDQTNLAWRGENVKPVLSPQEQRRTQEATQRQREQDVAQERVRQLAQLQTLIGKEIA